MAKHTLDLPISCRNNRHHLRLRQSCRVAEHTSNLPTSCRNNPYHLNRHEPLAASSVANHAQRVIRCPPTH